MAHFEEKNSFCLYLSSFTALNKKCCLQQILILIWICSFSNLLRKTNFLIISMQLSEIVTFLTKKIFFGEFHRKCFKTTEKHSLAVCGSPFYCLEQKELFTTNSIFLLICPFSNLLRKTNFLIISELLSEISSFLTKKRSFQ